ncbi:hypothetical protein [Rhodopila sp.]|uniref:hypothetical protein n=1 Tax=Rhodopila sp. TaxID=2480087 RepID=UPI003D0DBCD3
MIWIGGLVLAAAIYGIGPDRFLDVCLSAIATIDAMFHQLIFNLGFQVFGVVRALAIALYVMFVVLAILAAQRGQRSTWAMMVVTVLFLILVWRPYSEYSAPVGRWILAFALVLVGAIVMTQRLLAPPLRRDGPWPPQFPGRPK